MFLKAQLGQHPSFPGSLPPVQMQSQPWTSRRCFGQCVIRTLIPKKALVFGSYRGDHHLCKNAP